MPTARIDISGEPPTDGLTDELAIQLQEAGFHVRHLKEFLGYDVITSEMSASDALLAVITPGSSRRLGTATRSAARAATPAPAGADSGCAPGRDNRTAGLRLLARQV